MVVFLLYFAIFICLFLFVKLFFQFFSFANSPVDGPIVSFENHCSSSLVFCLFHALIHSWEDTGEGHSKKLFFLTLSFSLTLVVFF